jgi:hypothetical protein
MGVIDGVAFWPSNDFAEEVGKNSYLYVGMPTLFYCHCEKCSDTAISDFISGTEIIRTMQPPSTKGPVTFGCLYPQCKRGRLRVCYEIAPKRPYQS